MPIWKIECVGCNQTVDVPQHNDSHLQLSKQIEQINAVAINGEEGRKEPLEEVLYAFGSNEEKEALLQLELGV